MIVFVRVREGNNKRWYTTDKGSQPLLDRWDAEN